MSLIPLLNGEEEIRERIQHSLSRLGLDEGEGPRFNTFGEEQSIPEIVGTIIQRVKRKGDAAVVDCLKRIDGAELQPEGLLASPEELKTARESIEPELEQALQLMANRIRRYAQEMMPPEQHWFESEKGHRLGHRFTAIDNLGSYVPGGLGGSTPLISTVLMNLVPAVVAGVKSIVVATPCNREGKVHPALLRACEIAGATHIYKAGGAQGIAAMALGTESCPPCSKIIGPGNAFVQEAKRQLYGRIDIDMMAGPSEVAVIADAKADPAVVAADLIAQAEHDALASSFLFTDSPELAEAVARALELQLEDLPRRDIASASLRDFGALCVCSDLQAACRLSDAMAPEHLELSVSNPEALLPQLRHAGAIFMGYDCAEVMGDYTAGPSHTLPTCGAARFTSGITVYSFLKSSSLLYLDREAVRSDLAPLTAMARAENLEGHARSAEVRFMESQK